MTKTAAVSRMPSGSHASSLLCLLQMCFISFQPTSKKEEVLNSLESFQVTINKEPLQFRHPYVRPSLVNLKNLSFRKLVFGMGINKNISLRQISSTPWCVHSMCFCIVKIPTEIYVNESCQIINLPIMTCNFNRQQVHKLIYQVETDFLSNITLTVIPELRVSVLW